MRFPARTILAALTVVSLAKSPLSAAQDGGIRYVPIDAWLMPHVEYLQRAGLLPSIDPLTRPIQRGVLVRALEAIDQAGLSEPVSATVGLLLDELREHHGSVRWTLEPEAGVLGASDASRWTLRPSADSTGVYLQGRLTAALETDHFALVTSPYVDNRLKHDPWYRGKKDRFVAGRANPAYALLSLWPADAFFGVADRNWGPAGVDGLLLSPVSYAREHLFLRLGPPRLRIEVLAQQLDTIAPAAGPAPDRWLVAHRLVLLPSDRLAISFDESVLFASRGLPWRYLNPLALALLTQYEQPGDANAMLGASVSWRAARTLRLSSQIMIDDIQIDDDVATDNEPPGYAFSVAASGAAMSSATWSAGYTRVTNLAYRTVRIEEQYTASGVGLARNHSDYDQLQASFEVMPRRGLLAGLQLTLIRQGEGDLRLPYPPVAAYDDSLTFLTGTVERSLHIGANAIWTPSRTVSLSAYAGLIRITNAGHVAGADDSRFVWRLQGSLRQRFTGALER